jgi:hypothetical protein
MASDAFMNCGFVADVYPMCVFTAQRQILVGQDNVGILPYLHVFELD